MKKKNFDVSLYYFIYFSACENHEKSITYAQDSESSFESTAFCFEYDIKPYCKRGLSVRDRIYL